MKGPRIFITRRIAAQALKQLEGRVQMEVWEGSGPPPRAELETRMPHLDGLLSLLTDPASNLPDLAVITLTAGGRTLSYRTQVLETMPQEPQKTAHTPLILIGGLVALLGGAIFVTTGVFMIRSGKKGKNE